MIDVVEIEDRLNRLNYLYLGSSGDSELPTIYSKVAIMELGGWVEEARDELCRMLFDKVYDDANNEAFNNLFKGHISGFEYDEYFRRRVFERIIGKQGTKDLESKIDVATFEPFKANLNALWNQRNAHAHRTITGMASLTSQAPSVTLSQFAYIRDGLLAFQSVISGMERSRVSYTVYKLNG